MTQSNPKVLVVLSGGQDSTTGLYYVKHRITPDIYAITFDYGQRHNREIHAAMTIGAMAGVRSHSVVNVADVLGGTSPLVNPMVDVESYPDAASLPGGIEKTFVPMRNALFLTIAANRAVINGCRTIVTGVSMEDYGGYPDCREEFIRATENMINTALGESVDRGINILTPLMHMSKADTVRLAASLPGCLEALQYSHTCYQGMHPPCGTCHACLLRAKGFAEAGVVDPLYWGAA